MRLIQLLVEALLYYLACTLVARNRESAPGFIRVILVVLILALVAGGTQSLVTGALWHSGVILFILSFIILWIGLGIGFIRTILAALIVTLLHSVLQKVFATGPWV
jgi:hypothetical protein